MTDHSNAAGQLALLRRPEVTRRTGLSRSGLYARLKAGTFPKPVYLTPTTPAWVESEIAGWIATLLTARDAQRGQAA